VLIWHQENRSARRSSLSLHAGRAPRDGPTSRSSRSSGPAHAESASPQRTGDAAEI